MTITTRVQQQLFTESSAAPEALIRLPPTVVTNYATMASQQIRARRASRPRRRTNLWTVEEHDRFLRGLAQFPQGPWKEITAIVGTKTTRQTMTHAQKYRQKIERRQRANAPVEPLPIHYVEQSAQEGLNGKTTAFPAVDMMMDLHASRYASFSHLVHEASSPIEVGVDFFASTLLDPDLCSLMDDFDVATSTLTPTMSYIV